MDLGSGSNAESGGVSTWTTLATGTTDVTNAELGTYLASEKVQ